MLVWKKFFIMALLLVAGCATPEKDAPEQARFTPVGFDALAGWAGDDLTGAREALQRSCGKAKAAWRAVCAALPADERGMRDYLTTHFQPWRIAGDREDGLFTGYYAPEIKASRVRQGAYQTPLYGMPRDLAVADLGRFRPEWQGTKITGRVQGGAFTPYPSRAGIMAQALDAPVLVWVDDPVALFFLQVQGSGRAVFPDGTTLDIGYAGQNGQPYVAIGKILKEWEGWADGSVTMPRIRDWLARNPARRDTLLNMNPSYVFFRAMPGEAEGAQGVVLVPGRSLAVDPRYVALGTPVWLDAAHPDGGRLQRLMVAQDTGGAIKGVVRGDVYLGYGAQAENLAGKMQSRGRMIVLLPKGTAPDER